MSSLKLICLVFLIETLAVIISYFLFHLFWMLFLPNVPLEDYLPVLLIVLGISLGIGAYLIHLISDSSH